MIWSIIIAILFLIIIFDNITYFRLWNYLLKTHNQGKMIKTYIDLIKSWFVNLHPEDKTYCSMIKLYRISFGITILFILVIIILSVM